MKDELKKCQNIFHHFADKCPKIIEMFERSLDEF